MSKVLKVVGAIVGVAALIASGPFGLAAGTVLGMSASTLTLVAAALSLGSSLLAPRPKAPRVSPAAAERLFASINPRAPRTIAFGSTALATDIRDQEITGSQEYLHRFIVAASHKVQSIREIWFDDKLAWTLAGGVQGEFAGYLTVTPILEGSAANAINISARMGASRRYTGCAYIHLRYKLTGNDKKAESPFAQSIPSRMTIIGDGALIYDPRLDDTAGGEGDQRADDQTSWAWDAGAARNPALQLLWYLLGWRIQNPVTGEWKLAVGKGIPADRIDLASFITAANLCDEPVTKAAGGTEPRYRSDGVFSEADDPRAVIDSLKAAMNAELDDLGGRIRLTVLHNDLATPVADFTTDDVLGDFSWEQTPSLAETFNVLRGSYTDPSPESLYQLVEYPEIRIDSPDGIDRVETVDFPMVQSPSQAQRLAKQRIQRMLYSGLFAATFQITGWKVIKGDVVRLTFAPLGWSQKLFRVVEQEDARVDGSVPMVLRVEHAQIYAWDAEESPAIEAAAPTTYDAMLSPIVQGIGDAGETSSWPSVSDPLGTKPEDNATNTGDPDSPFWSETVGEFVVRVDAAQATLDAQVEDAEARLDAAEAELDAHVAATAIEVEALEGGISALDRARLDGEAAHRQLRRQVGTGGEALLQALVAQHKTRRIMRDAGIVVDPETAAVTMRAVEDQGDRLDQAEIRLVAQAAQIQLRATSAWVSEQIALAVIDPSQIAELEDIYARLGAAEVSISGLLAAIELTATAAELSALELSVTELAVTIDALGEAITLKADTSTLTALDARVGSVETVLSTLGDVSSIVSTVRQTRFMVNDTALATLKNALAQHEANKARRVADAQARTEIFAKVDDGLTAEAGQRSALAVEVAANAAAIVTEAIARADDVEAITSLVTAAESAIADLETGLDIANAAISTEAATRASEIDAVAEDIETLSAALDDQAALILVEQLVNVRQDESIASMRRELRVMRSDGSTGAEATLKALLAGHAARKQVGVQFGLVREDTYARIVAGESVIAGRLIQITARQDAADASFVAEQVARADGDSANATAILALTADVETLDGHVTAEIARLDTADATESAARAAAIAGLSAEIGDIEAGLTTAQAAIVDLEAQKAEASDLLALTARVDDAEASLITVNEVLVDLEGSKAEASALTALSVRMDDAEAGITTAQAAIVDLEAGKAEASDLTALTVRMDDAEAGITAADAAIIDLEAGKAEASAVTALTARMDEAEAEIVTVAAVAAEADGIAKAIYGVKLDVNGRATGFSSENDGDTSGFVVVADEFRLVDPDTEEDYFTVDEDGAKLRNVEVDTLKVNTAVVPIIFHNNGNALGGIGDTWQTIVSTYIDLPVDGVVEVVGSYRQGFGSGDQAWTLEVYINDVLQPGGSAGRTQDIVPIYGIEQCEAGLIPVLVRWRAHSSVSVTGWRGRISGFPATEASVVAPPPPPSPPPPPDPPP